ncbi:hypothetical protein T02_10102 [Trichinella nativa]|uniref:Uncharacterized protein n=1 Tax=Trichinella nativa TaxID=6335 RepID=A0A0V1KV93_9BILA|nr:hypothetical protein T02_10102 [Trichinella nativa]
MKAVVFCIMHTTQYCRDKVNILSKETELHPVVESLNSNVQINTRILYKIINALQVKRARINFVTAEGIDLHWSESKREKKTKEIHRSFYPKRQGHLSTATH